MMLALSRLPCVATLSLLLALAGCAGHSERTAEARTALDVGQPEQALQLLNEELDVDSAKELPDEVEDDETLLLMDRAMVLQQLGVYTLSSRDLEFADKRVEVLDLSRNAVDDLGRYLYSDDAGPYRAPAYEKLMINTMNMVNYLARSDLNGARIEARRLAVMQRFISERQDPAQAFIGAGSYLAGFTFEYSGNADTALRYYDEALRYGDYQSLYGPVARLAQQGGYRSPRIRRVLETQAAGAGGTTPNATPAQPDNTGELLVIVNFGRVPAKIAKRVPIGLALTYASGALSPTDQGQANRLAAQGLVTWVNYPELGRPRGQYDQPEFSVDGRWQHVDGILAVDRQAQRAWEDARGSVVASAITRAIARILAGQGAGEVGEQVTGSGILGLLFNLGTQATLTAADTPDTRSWSMLPARIAIGRLRLAPGKHSVVVGARGSRKRYQVDIRPGDFSVLNHTVLY